MEGDVWGVEGDQDAVGGGTHLAGELLVDVPLAGLRRAQVGEDDLERAAHGVRRAVRSRIDGVPVLGPDRGDPVRGRVDLSRVLRAAPYQAQVERPPGGCRWRRSAFDNIPPIGHDRGMAFWAGQGISTLLRELSRGPRTSRELEQVLRASGASAALIAGLAAALARLIAMGLVRKRLEIGGNPWQANSNYLGTHGVVSPMTEWYELAKPLRFLGRLWLRR